MFGWNIILNKNLVKNDENPSAEPCAPPSGSLERSSAAVVAGVASSKMIERQSPGCPPLLFFFSLQAPVFDCCLCQHTIPVTSGQSGNQTSERRASTSQRDPFLYFSQILHSPSWIAQRLRGSGWLVGHSRRGRIVKQYTERTCQRMSSAPPPGSTAPRRRNFAGCRPPQPGILP